MHNHIGYLMGVPSTLAAKLLETLFQGDANLVSLLLDSAMRTGMDSEFLGNVVLSGGNTMIKGMRERFTEDLSKSAHCAVNVIAPPDRQLLVWNGGSIFAATSGFQSKLCSKRNYEEQGAQFIHKVL